MAQQDYVAFAFKKGSEAESKFINLNDLLNMFARSVHLTDNGEVSLYTATLPFHRGYSTKIDQYLDIKLELPEDQFDFIRIGEAREDYDDETPNGLIYIDGDDVTVAGLIKLVPKKKTPSKREQKYLAIVIGGTTLDWFNSTTPIPDVVKLIDKPMTREKAAKEMFANLEDAIVNCDERFIDVAKYKADGANQLRFRITDKDEHEADLQTIKQQLIDGGIDVVNVKPSACAPSLYCLVPVKGDS